MWGWEGGSVRLTDVSEDEVLEPHLLNGPGGIEDRPVRSDQHGRLPFGVALVQDLGHARHPPDLDAWTADQPMVPQQSVDVAGHLRPGRGEQDQVVADALEVRDEVRGQHHGDPILRHALHQDLEELSASKRVQAGQGLVQQQQFGTLAQGQRQRNLRSLPAG